MGLGQELSTGQHSSLGLSHLVRHPNELKIYCLIVCELVLTCVCMMLDCKTMDDAHLGRLRHVAPHFRARGPPSNSGVASLREPSTCLIVLGDCAH